MVTSWSFRSLLENVVHEVLKLVLSWLSVGFCFHWSQYNIHRVDLLELTGTDNGPWKLLVLHCWNDCTDLALQGAVAISDGAD